MRSTFSIAGHPIHPMLIPLPIGLLSWALFSIIVYAFNDSGTWYDMAYWTAIGGIVTGIVAAIPGFVDYATVATKSDAAGIATAHMGLNIATLVLYGVGAFVMFDDGAREGAALSAVVALFALGGGMLALSGLLGGEMSYRHHLGMIPDDGAEEQAEQRRHVERRTSRVRR